MRIGLKDEKVLAAFAERRAADGLKLTTDGRVLDGNWLGGRRIAEWVGDVVRMNDLRSRAAQSVQRSLKRHLAPVQVEGYRPRYQASYGSRPRRDLPRKGPGTVRWLEERQERSNDAYWRRVYRARRLAQQGRYAEAERLVEGAQTHRKVGDRYARAKVGVGRYVGHGAGWVDRDRSRARAEDRPWRVRDKLTRQRYYFESRPEAESFVSSVGTSELTGEPLRRWFDRMVVERNR